MRLFAVMSSAEPKLINPVNLVVDAILVLAFFAYMFSVFLSHVPSQKHSSIVLWAALTASCLAGVFWLALQMFRVVLRFQRRGDVSL